MSGSGITPYLFVGYTPIARNSQRSTTDKEYKRAVKALKISDPQLWEGFEAEETVHSLAPRYNGAGKETGSWFGLRNEEITTIDLPIDVSSRAVNTAGFTLTKHPFETGLLASAAYDKNILLICGWNAPLMLIDINDGFKIRYKGGHIYRYQTDLPSLWCNFSRCLVVHRPYVYMVQRNTNNVIRYHIPQLLEPNPPESALKVIKTSASEICVDSTGHLYCIGKTGRIEKDGVHFATIAKPASAVWNGLAHNGKRGQHQILLAAGSSAGQIVLFDSRGTERHRLKVKNCETGYDEIMRVKIFSVGRLELAIVGKEYNNVFVVSIHKKKLYMIKDLITINPKSPGTKLITGIYVRQAKLHSHKEEILISQNSGISSIVFSL